MKRYTLFLKNKIKNRSKYKIRFNNKNKGSILIVIFVIIIFIVEISFLNQKMIMNLTKVLKSDMQGLENFYKDAYIEDILRKEVENINQAKKNGDIEDLCDYFTVNSNNERIYIDKDFINEDEKISKYGYFLKKLPNGGLYYKFIKDILESGKRKVKLSIYKKIALKASDDSYQENFIIELVIYNIYSDNIPENVLKQELKEIVIKRDE